VAVSATWARIPGAGARAGPLGAEYCHLAGEVLDKLQKCGAVGVWDNISERRLGCGLGDAVRTGIRGVQVALVLAGENGLYAGVAGRIRCCRGSRLARLGRGS
jgi:hypothetical protein